MQSVEPKSAVRPRRRFAAEASSPVPRASTWRVGWTRTRSSSTSPSTAPRARRSCRLPSRGLRGPPGLRRARPKAHLHRAPLDAPALFLRDGDDRGVPPRGQGADLLRPERPCRGALPAPRPAPVGRADRPGDLGDARGDGLDRLRRLARGRGRRWPRRLPRRGREPSSSTRRSSTSTRPPTRCAPTPGGSTSSANEAYTYLFASPTRGKAAPDEAGVLTDFAGLMVHDLKGPETCLSGLTRHDATGQARPPWPCPLSTVCSDASSRFFVSTGPIPRRKMQRSSCSATSWPCFAAKSPVPASPGPTVRSSLCLPVSSPGNAGSRSSSRRRRSLAGTARSSAGAGPTRTGGRAARLFRTRPSS